MRPTSSFLFRYGSFFARNRTVSSDLSFAPIIDINSGTFYRQHPNATHQTQNPPLFPDLSFSLPSQPVLHRTISRPESLGIDSTHDQQHWAVIGTDGKTVLLEILRGSHIAIPPASRTFPYLSSEAIAQKDNALRVPSRAIQYVGFTGDRGQSSGGVRGAYLSARYESHREDTDWTVLQYLRGETELNPTDPRLKYNPWDESLLSQVIKDLRLNKLLNMPVGNLSNGQTRRARIAKALLGKPEVLLLDDPFMGLDPPTLTTLSPMLKELAYKSSPRLILSLRPQDPIPDWITHLAILGENNTLALQGKTAEVLSKMRLWADGQDIALPSGQKLSASEMTKRFGPALTEIGQVLREKKPEVVSASSSQVEPATEQKASPTSAENPSEVLVELKDVVVRYGDKAVLGRGSTDGINLSIYRGTRLLIVGPNGSGKTTLLSLLTSDHPQSYSLSVFHFGRSRLPQVGQAGISIFDIQSRIGHSSPEIHAFFPKSISIRGTLESAWADTFTAIPSVPTSAHKDIDAVLRWFEPELNPNHQSVSGSLSPAIHIDTSADVTWASKSHSPTFFLLPFQAQRLLLLLRALVKRPDVVILDEGFSGLSPYVREKALAFLETGFTTFVQHDSKGWKRVPAEQSTEIGFRGIDETQALVVVSHVREEVPTIVNEWLRLPGEEELDLADSDARQKVTIRRGREDRGGVASHPDRWREIWGI